MKIGFIIPILDDYDFEVAFKNVDKACKETQVDYDIIFALNNSQHLMFTKIRSTFVEQANVKAFMSDRGLNEHQLITLAMLDSERYDACVVYSAKEETNVDVIKAFITSWQAGNKIVYLKKVYRGFARFTQFLKEAIYKAGVFVLGLFKDNCVENDIQLLDADVVKTINQLPNKNQMLRVLDSMVYYAVDTIHLQVDTNEFVNPVYTTKPSGYTQMKIASLVTGVLGFALFFTSILVLALEATMPFLVHLLFWSLALISAVLSVVFGTKSALNRRAGGEWALSDITAVKNKIEYYNF